MDAKVGPYMKRNYAIKHSSASKHSHNVGRNHIVAAAAEPFFSACIAVFGPVIIQTRAANISVQTQYVLSYKAILTVL